MKILYSSITTLLYNYKNIIKKIIITMTNLRTEKLITKIFWFSLPFIISFFIWITVTIFSTSSSMEVLKQQGIEREKTQEKIWVMLQDNNKMLQSKADEIENKKDHQAIMIKIDDMEKKIDRNYNKKNIYGNNEKKDTIITIPAKEYNSLVMNKNFYKNK